MSASKSVSKSVKPAAVKPATNVQANTVAPINNGLTALVQQAVANVTATASIKPVAVTLTNGVNPLAPANAPIVQLGGAAYNGTLPGTNPALRGIVGTPSAKLGNGLTLGNGKAPRSAHGAVMWQAVCTAIAAGNNTPAQLATAAGSGGAAFVGYCVKNGWLAKA
jgi:hypothetical protein